MTLPFTPVLRLPLALALLAGAFLTGPLAAGILQGPVTNPANGHTYYLLTQTRSRRKRWRWAGIW